MLIIFTRDTEKYEYFHGLSVKLNLSVYWNTFYSFEEYKIIERNILGTLKGNQNKAAKTLTMF